MSGFAPQETQYYDRLFSTVDKDDSGVIAGQDALPFLTSSNLPQQTLGEIWALADPDNNGFLTKEGWYKAARLVGWVQKGGSAQVEESLLTRQGPLPTFAGHEPPPQIGSGLSQQSTGSSLPPLTPADRTKFTRIFVSCGPQNGQVSGDKAREVLLKSQLSHDKLGQIWNLADTQQRGSLDLTDFIIAMYLVQSCMAKPSMVLPDRLPPGTYESASGGRQMPISAQHTGSLSRQNTGPQAASPVKPQYTGSGIRPQNTGQSMTGSPARSMSGLTGRTFQPAALWDVTDTEKATSDRFFTQLDSNNQGVIEGDVAVPFMLQSQLDEGSLATIWDLADIRHEGKLTKDEFAVAMHLISAKLAGKDLPSALPQSLIPPSLRGTNIEQPPASSSGPSQDLFDLFNDPPATTNVPSAAPTSPVGGASPAFAPPTFSRNTAAASAGPTMPRSFPQAASPPPVAARSPPPPTDLLGDDAAGPENVTANSADLANKRTQYDSVSRNLDTTTKEREGLETKSKSNEDEISQLEADLSSARVKHEAETKLVADLRNRLSEQTNRLKILREDVIATESDLSAMRSEKDEIGQSLLRDKEEVRSLQARMKEMNDEKVSLKSLLEKMKKEARQQKGMVSIAKKQLTTAETSRDAAQKDLDNHSASVSEVQRSPPPVESAKSATQIPLPGTPRSLSPIPTGGSQRSNNPFDRQQGGRSESLMQTASRDLDSSPVPPAEATNAEFGAEAAHPAPAGSDVNDISLDPFATTPRTTTDPLPSTQEEAHPVEEGVQQAKPTDFDTAFAEFDDDFGSNGAPVAPATENAKEVTKDFAAEESDIAPSASVAGPSANFVGFDNEFVGEEQSMSKSINDEPISEARSEVMPTTVIPAVSMPAVPGDHGHAEGASDEADSSDDEVEEPEDIENAKPGPRRSSPGLGSATIGPDMALPDSAQDNSAKVRRSAPPPPSKAPISPAEAPINTGEALEASTEDAPPRSEPTISTSHQPSTQAGFDDDDFDFSDMSAAKVDQSAPVSTATSKKPEAFDDDFATFEDEFDKNDSQGNSGGSDGSTSLSKGYEMVAPPTAEAGKSQNQPQEPHQSTSQSDPSDIWGFSSLSAQPPAPQTKSPWSFDDAFGGDFGSAPLAPPIPNQGSQLPGGFPQFDGQPASESIPAPVAPSATASAPAAATELPRRATEAQNDDIEDVQKLCGMGFSRTLVVEALAANGYDFQKALNVLLEQ